MFQFSSVQSLSCVRLFATPWTAAHQASLSITNPNSCPLSWWCHSTISSSVVPFSSCLQSFPASGSFPGGGQRIGVSALASVLPVNTQDWSPLGWTGCISLQSKELLKTSLNATYHLILTLTLSVDIYFQQSVIMYTWLSSSLSGPMIA